MDFYQFKKRHPRLVMVLLLYVLVPVVIGLALGYEMHGDSPTVIPTVVANMDGSEFSRTFIDQIDKTATLSVVAEVSGAAEAEELIRTGKALAGLVIPADFAKDMTSGKSPDMLIIYDASQLAVLSVAKPAVTEIMLTMNGAYLQKIFAGKLGVVPSALMGQVAPVSVTYRNLYNPTKSFRYYLLPGMLLAVLQVGICMLGAERGYNNRREAHIPTHLLTIVLWGLLGALGVLVCLGVQLVCFGLPYRSTICGGLLLLLLYTLVITLMGYLVGLLVPDKLFATQLAAMLVLPTSVLGGYSYPLTAMPAAYQTLAKFLPYTYMGSDLRALCLKNMQFGHVLPHIGVMLMFAAVLLLLLALVLAFKAARRAKEAAA